MKRLMAILIALMIPAMCAAETTAATDYAWKSIKEGVRTYDTETLKYTVDKGKIGKTLCYVTRVWMQEPGKQIKKATSKWKKNLALPSDMAKKVPGAALVINGSGYVSKTYPEIPDNYPGKSPDYYYTPLGSVTVVDGEVLRNLEDVPFYGLTLQEDGLHLHVGEMPADVLAAEPTQTWSFYEKCPLIQNYESIVDREWAWANHRATRTIIAKVDENNYVILTATNNSGLTLLDATDFLLENFAPEWAYNLDGGPSSALICRSVGKKTMKIIFGGEKKDVDIMAFVELTEE